MPEDSHDKRLAVKYFRRKGIEACIFPRTSDMPNPDFRLYIDGELFAYCELKSIIHYELLSSHLLSGQICQIERNSDPSFNNVQRKIHDASLQLKSVNANHDLRNILFFINHNRHLNVGDLKEVIGVPLSNVSDIPCPLYPKCRNRLLLKNDLSVIDYIIFLDLYDKTQSVDAMAGESGEDIVFDDYAKDFITDTGVNEEWAKDAVSRRAPLNKAYYFLLAESRFSEILKKKISKKSYEILPNSKSW